MVKKRLTPQQRWNHKHKSKMNRYSTKYYYKNRKILLKKLKLKYRQDK